MSAIVESISNGLSAPPLAAATAQTGSVQRAGGFASAFAAARGFSAGPETRTGEAEEPDVPMAKNANGAMSLLMRSTASANSQLKKLQNRDIVAASTLPATNAAAEFIPAAATPITPISLPLQASVPVAVTAIAQGGGLRGSTGTVLSGSYQSGSYPSGSSQFGLSESAPSASRSQTAAYEVATQSAGFSYSPLNDAAGIFSAAASAAASRGGAAGSLQPPVLSLVAGRVVPSLPQNVGETQGNGSYHGPVSAEPTETAESTVPFVLAATTQTLMSGTFVSQVPGNPTNGIQADGLGAESGDAIPQANQAAGGVAFVPILLANAGLESGAQAGVQAAFAEKVNIVQASSDDGALSDAVQDTVVQGGEGAQTGAGNPLAAIFSGQVVPSAVLNPAEAAGPVRAGLQLAASRVVSAITGVRGGTGARTLTPAAAASTATGSSSVSSIGSPMELPGGSQTPFSVFFSSPGPGTESAASALPKLILPPNSAAIRDGYGSGVNGSSANRQSGGVPGGISQNGASPNAGPPTKDSLNGSASESLQTSSASRRDADANAAAAQLAAAPTGATPVAAPVPPSSAAVPMPLGAPAVPVSDPLPKPDVPPAPAAVVPAPAETLPAALGPVQMAQVMNRIGQSEMRIGMNTSAFGSVDVRTVVHGNDVGLVIGSEKGDLHTLLANDMPAIANTLQQQNLRLSSVNFMQGFAFSNNGSGGGGDSRQQSFVPMRAASSAGQSEAAVGDSSELSAAEEFASSGLSILA